MTSAKSKISLTGILWSKHDPSLPFVMHGSTMVALMLRAKRISSTRETLQPEIPSENVATSIHIRPCFSGPRFEIEARGLSFLLDDHSSVGSWNVVWIPPVLSWPPSKARNTCMWPMPSSERASERKMPESGHDRASLRAHLDVASPLQPVELICVFVHLFSIIVCEYCEYFHLI